MKIRIKKTGQPEEVNISDLSMSIAPNIFDAYLNPSLLLPLVLGNLLSPKLWALNAKLIKRLKNTPPPSEDQAQNTAGPMAYIRAIQREIDRNFTHLQQNQLMEIYGELDLTEEKNRLGEENIVRAMQALKNFYLSSLHVATIPEDVTKSILTSLEQQRFPAFSYANFDVIRANRLAKGSRASASMGLTSCLDEVAIFAALAMTLPPGMIGNVVVLSFVSHYTAFAWTQTDEICWFYGKNQFFSQAQWKQLVDEEFNGDAQRAFDHRMMDFDRITSVAGTFEFKTGHTSITPDHIDAIVEKLDQFFCCRLSQVAAALEKTQTVFPELAITPILRELLGTQSIERARSRLSRSEDSSCLQVLYSYRSLELASLYPYLQVARQNSQCKKLGSAFNSIDEALELVRNIAGQHSIFGDRLRIAMPDETLRLQTGSDIDKALLLHVLIEHFHTASDHTIDVYTLITQDDSFVCFGDFCLSLMSMRLTQPPTLGVIMKFADPDRT
jgi:hypothetical protein